MAGSGVVDVVDDVSDRDGAPVWRLILQDSPGNAEARNRLWVNGTVKAMFEPHVAINLSQHRYPICPIKAGATISWGPHHVDVEGGQYVKDGDEYDPNAPLSPP